MSCSRFLYYVVFMLFLYLSQWDFECDRDSPCINGSCTALCKDDPKASGSFAICVDGACYEHPMTAEDCNNQRLTFIPSLQICMLGCSLGKNQIFH